MKNSFKNFIFGLASVPLSGNQINAAATMPKFTWLIYLGIPLAITLLFAFSLFRKRTKKQKPPLQNKT